MNKKVLTYQQALELKWFCGNVAGVRQSFYSVMDVANSFDDRIKRLEKTCDLINDFLKPEESKPPYKESEG